MPKSRQAALGMIVYHSTTAETAKKIIEHGFRDGRGRFLTASEWVGVWVSDRPLDQNEGAKGDTVLKVNLAVSEAEIAQYEWVQEGSSYREWLMPAELLNSGEVRLATDDDASLLR
jgi:hypothetical protein